MENKQKISIGIIGFGRFGRLLTQILKEEFRIIVYSKPKPKNFPSDPKIKLGRLKEIAGCKIIILAVPINAFSEVIKEISPHLKKDNLVVDVCSVKKYPVEIMKKNLPKNVEILASHPVFGPASFKGKLDGLKVVIWPLRIKKERYQKIKNWLKKKKLKIVEISPEEHDRLAARSQVLPHFIGRILEIMKIKETKIDTLNFKKLLELKEAISKDSFQLSLDIQRFNPYTKKMRQDFKKALEKIEKMIRS